MEPILNPKITANAQGWFKRHYSKAKLQLASLSFFQKAVLCLLVLNLIFAHAASQAAQEALNEAAHASTSASSAEGSADDAKDACEKVTRGY